MRSLEYQEYLAHHGVKGMKWGEHLFGKDDENRRRKKQGIGPHNDSMASNKKSEKPESKTWKSRDTRYLSDEELKRRNNRLQLENQYKQNIDNSHQTRKEVKNIAKKIFLYTAVGAVSGFTATQYKSVINFLIDYKNTPLAMLPQLKG